MNKNILTLLKSARTKLAVLIDPDNQTEDSLMGLSEKINKARVDVILVGGSILLDNHFEKYLRSYCTIPGQ